ncbi:hypothetical protein GLOIN_2v1484259 [Rhizophagus irregularis DAOM 181602=DAOM 197198]|uniref:Uncharacterized protein n=1 Tax=Rhizophagus irregularis (strain DAOM 181602 / DAOM 197198 / MUCL 43194) TaxID=747089 RepID=A0A2P4PEX7_RHIID|nr:hypothetical protein GLOIN_2v1484259 [Rhizophagus irregularis DAOM 181602=DAOM 197198]POG63946.1 hypothetical protein GLOIN_2v1484259 [Rhizophagus irregularis DAOM 181602=DAOM 197198]GBC24830.2 hypothetical protein GLOIN_2v1484259 [Rhizophagus irregularis DAOM 181602=DAOM 197198]|eukprot:XP_025170812.1 hypothetical protein GLOIN_2v1484259 [Rhizophagus irregularis DAOM 181602=DAOM 197198]
METRRSISSLSTESRLSEVTSAEASNSTRIDDEKKKDEKYKSVLENDETSEAEERTLAIEERKLVIREQMAKVCFKMANIENEQEARKERTLAIEERKLVIREQTAKVRKEQEARTIKETLTLQKKQRKYTFHLFPF